MVPHQRTSGYRSGSMSASAMMRSNAIEARQSMGGPSLSAIWTPCGACQWVALTNLKSVNLSSEAYGFGRRPVTSLGYVPPRRRPAQRNDVRPVVAAHLVPQRPLQCSPTSAPIQDPGRHPSPSSNISTGYQSPREATGPGAAVAKAVTKCHLWMGLPCDRLNGL